MNPRWPPAMQAMWQRIADVVEAPCGACRGGTLRLHNVTVEYRPLQCTTRYTALLRCDQCESEMAQHADMDDVAVALGDASLRFPRELNANKG